MVVLSVTKLFSPPPAQCLSAVASCLILGGNLSSPLHSFCWSPQAQPHHPGPALRDAPTPKKPQLSCGCGRSELSGPQHTSQHCCWLVHICLLEPHFRLCCSLCACHLVFPNWTSLLSLCFCTNLPLMARCSGPLASKVSWLFFLSFPFLFYLALLIPLRQPPWAEFTPCPLERTGRI